MEYDYRVLADLSSGEHPRSVEVLAQPKHWIAKIGVSYLLILSILMLALSGCEQMSASLPSSMRLICESLELCEPVLLPRESIILLLDHGSPRITTPNHVGATLDNVLPRMIRRPGSTLRILFLAGEQESPDEVRSLGEAQSPERAARQSLKAWQRTIEQWRADTRRKLLANVSPVLATLPCTRYSMAQAIASVAINAREKATAATNAPAPPLLTHLVVVSDGFERSISQVICAPKFASDGAWTGDLQWKRWLKPGVLAGVSVHLTYYAPVNVNWCPATIIRDGVLRALWGSVLAEAGAEEVMIEDGVLHWPDEPSAVRDGKAWRLVVGRPSERTGK